MAAQLDERRSRVIGQCDGSTAAFDRTGPAQSLAWDGSSRPSHTGSETCSTVGGDIGAARGQRSPVKAAEHVGAATLAVVVAGGAAAPADDPGVADADGTPGIAAIVDVANGDI